jgi:uncharacterized protein (DUF697 family)
MAKKQRPSFSATPPQTPAARPDTGWVYRTEDPDPPVGVADTPSHHARGLSIVNKYAGIGAGAGVIPLPWLDMAALWTVQMLMVRELAAEYEHPFEAEGFKAVLSSLTGVLATRWAGGGWGRSLLKSIPVIGTFAGGAAMAAFGSASTYAIGRAFVAHFENGGTLHDLRSDAGRDQLRRDVAQLA